MTITHSAAPGLGARIAALPKLGVGVLFNPSLTAFVQDHVEALDYLAVIPDRFWSDEGPAAAERYDELERMVELLDGVAERLPIVGHSVGLSIGSAEWFDTQHVEQVRVLLDAQRGLIIRLEMRDSDGDRTLISFSNVKTNVGLKDADLELHAPPGVKSSRSTW